VSRGAGVVGRRVRGTSASSVPCATSERSRVNCNCTDLWSDFTDCAGCRTALRSPNAPLTNSSWARRVGWSRHACPQAVRPWCRALSMPRSNPWNP